MGGQTIDIVKRHGKRPSEGFDRQKLYTSVLAACLSAQCPPGQAESIAVAVCSYVEEWLETRHEVTSHDLRRVAIRHLTIHHPDAAYLYEQHRSII